MAHDSEVEVLRVPGAFDACRQSQTWLIPLRRELIFPWRIRKGHAPHLGDHICRADPEIAALMQQPDDAEFYNQLCSDRMQHLSRLHRHFGLNVFLRGPGLVPQRVFEPDLPENFFFNTAPPDGAAD